MIATDRANQDSESGVNDVNVDTRAPRVSVRRLGGSRVQVRVLDGAGARAHRASGAARSGSASVTASAPVERRVCAIAIRAADAIAWS